MSETYPKTTLVLTAKQSKSRHQRCSRSYYDHFNKELLKVIESEDIDKYIVLALGMVNRAPGSLYL